MDATAKDSLREQMKADRQKQVQEHPWDAIVRRMNLTVTSHFLRELSSLVAAGFGLPRALDTIARNTGSARMRTMVQALHGAVESGIPLHRAMADHPRFFDTVAVNVVRASEESARMAEGLEYIAMMLEREETTRSRFINALAYPIVLLGMGFLIFGIVLFFVVPAFTDVIERAGGELTGSAASIGAMSSFLRSPAGQLLFWVLMIAPFAGFLSLRVAARRVFDTIVMYIPFFGRLMLKAESSRVAGMLHMMTASGVSLADALHLASATSGNTYVNDAVEDMAKNATEGRSLSSALQKYPRLPYVFPEMIAVGEESGRLGPMLEHVHRTTDREVEDAVQRLPALLQPLLLFAIGVGIIAMFMMYFVPYFDLLMGLSRVQ